MGREGQKMVGLWIPDEQHEQFSRWAKKEGQTVSEWLRGLGAREIAPPVPQQVVAATDEHPAIFKEGGRLVAGKKADAEFAGVRVLVDPEMPTDAAGMMGANGTNVAVFNVGDAPVKSWADKWPDLLQKKADEPDAFYEDMARLAPGFKPKQGFWQLPIKGQVKALDEKYPLGGA